MYDLQYTIDEKMTKEDLIKRNRKFVIGVLRLIDVLPTNRIYDAIARQLVRCSTSIGANYRSACRAKSTADFINKLKIVEEEADETEYFLDLLNELGEGKFKAKINQLLIEVRELVAIYVASIKTARTRIDIKINRKS